MKPSSCKAKGRAFQQWIRDMWYVAFRHLEEGDIISTSMGNSGVDIQLSPLARKSIPYSIEAKSHKAFAVYQHYAQAVSNSKYGTPLLFIKANAKRPLAIVDAEYFIRLHSYIPEDVYQKVTDSMKGSK